VIAGIDDREGHETVTMSLDVAEKVLVARLRVPVHHGRKGTHAGEVHSVGIHEYHELAGFRDAETAAEERAKIRVGIDDHASLLSMKDSKLGPSIRRLASSGMAEYLSLPIHASSMRSVAKKRRSAPIFS